jgi:hypothetical protein
MYNIFIIGKKNVTINSNYYYILLSFLFQRVMSRLRLHNMSQFNKHQLNRANCDIFCYFSFFVFSNKNPHLNNLKPEANYNFANKHIA